MPVPMNDPRVSISMRETLANCATFRRLCDAADVAAARGSIHLHLMFDGTPDTVDPTDPDRQPPDPFPRALIGDSGPQTTFIPGYSPMGGGMLEVLIEFKQFTEEQLDSWYGSSLGVIDSRDHWAHADNLKVAIRNEMLAIAYAPAGCLKIIRLVDQVCGDIDYVTENGIQLWQVVFFVFWEGLP